MVFFDKFKEIEGVEIINFKNFSDKKVKSKKKNAAAEIFANWRCATLIKINTKKKTFIKSFTIIRQGYYSKNDIYDGTLEIQLLENKNGIPDDTAEILSFQEKIFLQKNIKNSLNEKWEIQLPKIIEYPKDGFFIVFKIKTDKIHTIFLKLNNDSKMMISTEKYPAWREMNFNSFYYQLKIIQ